LAKAKREGKESIQKTNTHGAKTVKITSNHTEVKDDENND
jgi:hypothetical protein